MGFQVKCAPVMDTVPCCCCSCDLKVATIILGWFGLIGNVGSFLKSVLDLALFEDPKDLLLQGYKEVMITTVVSSTIGILLMALLLYGAHTEKPIFMLPAVIVDMIGIVILIVAVIVVSILIFMSSLLFGFIFLLVGVLLVGLSIYFWVIIYSYYQKLEKRQNPFSSAPLDNFDKEVTMHIGHP